MSYFVFGQIINLNAAKGCSSAFQKNVKGALYKSGVSFEYGKAITIPIVHQMLREQELKIYSDYPTLEFFSKKSIDDDTSDSLISPTAADFGTEDPVVDAIKGVYLLFEVLGALVKNFGSEIALRLLITEGYDTEFQCLKCNLNNAKRHLTSCIQDNYSIPSIEYRIFSNR